MPGIQLPIGIETLNPVPADFKYGPYANTAAALAAIPLALRYDGLTVKINGAGEYWWLAADLSNTGLIPKIAGTSGPVSITKAALLALIGINGVAVGTVYSITDAQDALGGTVTVTGTATNQVDGSGKWSFLSKTPAQGYFRIVTGAAGTLTQINIAMPSGSVNLLTAPIPYTTSRNNTAALAAANINANSLVSGCRAFVMTSPGVIDTPTLCIEAVETTTGFAHTMVVTISTMTIANQVNPTNGLSPVNTILDSVYDIVTDRITEAYDDTQDNRIVNTPARITSLGYNPVTTFRWKDTRLLSFLLTNSGMRNIVFSGTGVKANAKLNNSSIANVTYTTFSDLILTNSTISNVGGTNNSMSIVDGTINFTDVQFTGGSNISGCYSFILSATSTSISGFSNILSNTGIVTINAATIMNSSFTFTNNTISPGVSAAISMVMGGTYLGVVNISENKIFDNCTLSAGGTGTGSVVFIENSIFGKFNLACTTSMVSVNIRRNTFRANGSSLAFNAFNLQGPVLPTVTVLDSVLCYDVTTNQSPTTFSISDSEIFNSTISASLILDLNYARIIGANIGSTGGTLNYLQVAISTIDGLGGISLTDMFVQDSYIQGLYVNDATNLYVLSSTVNIVNFYIVPDLQLTKCNLSNFNYTSTTLNPLVLVQTTIDNYAYRVSYYYDFTALPLVPGSPVTICNHLEWFGKTVVSVGSLNLITFGAGANLQVKASSGTTYMNLLASAIGPIGTLSRDTTPVASVEVSEGDLVLEATVASITGGQIHVQIEGLLMSPIL